MNNLSIREVSTGVLSSTRLRLPCFLSRRCFFLQDNLVGGFNPSENHYSNWIISLNRGEHRNDWNHHLAIDRFTCYPSPNSCGFSWFSHRLSWMRGAHVAGGMKAPGIQGEFLLSIDVLVFHGTIPPWEKENHLKRPRKGDMLVLRRVIERTICFCLFVFVF